MMLNIGLQTYFLDSLVDDWGRRCELKIGSSIPTRRGRTDANTPERLRTAILRDWHVGISDPMFFEIYEELSPT